MARPCPVHDCKNLLAISHNCQCVGNDATATNCGNMLHTGADKQCHSPNPLPPPSLPPHPSLHTPLAASYATPYNPRPSPLLSPTIVMWHTWNHLTCPLTVNFGLHFWVISANPSRRRKRFRQSQDKTVNLSLQLKITEFWLFLALIRISFGSELFEKEVEKMKWN